MLLSSTSSCCMHTMHGAATVITCESSRIQPILWFRIGWRTASKQSGNGWRFRPVRGEPISQPLKARRSAPRTWCGSRGSRRGPRSRRPTPPPSLLLTQHAQLARAGPGQRARRHPLQRCLLAREKQQRACLTAAVPGTCNHQSLRRQRLPRAGRWPSWQSRAGWLPHARAAARQLTRRPARHCRRQGLHLRMLPAAANPVQTVQ